ncbi:UNVERIFIED_CONTAM: hypothetical protein RMT77_010009 [Armadillidium vulgare]
MEDKIKNAAQKTKQNVSYESNHNAFLTDFCKQLDKENVPYERERTFVSWGTPDVYINAYGPVKIISKTSGIHHEDTDQCQKYANGSRQKCTLISFGTQRDTPTYQYFYLLNER